MDNFDNLIKRERFKTLVKLELLNRGWWPSDGPGDHPPTFYATNGKKRLSIVAIPQRLHQRGLAVTQSALELEGAFFILGVYTKEGIKWLVLTRDEMLEKCVGNLAKDGRYKIRIPKDLKGWSEHYNRWDKLET